MSTASTKSRDRKQDDEQADVELLAPDAPEISPLMWRVASILILAGAAFIRLYELGLKPMHHDEGVNGFFLTNLFRKGVYHYDPTNYHGPTLYYFALVVTKINGLLFGEQAGLSTIAVRLVPVIFGVGTIWLVLCLRRNIGTIGALAAAAFIALSPGHVFISRYFIHESHFVFFTLGIVVAAIRYYESGDPLYLLLASVSAALLFATKETAIISAGVLLVAFNVATVYKRFTKFVWLALLYIGLQSAIIYLWTKEIETTLKYAAIAFGVLLVVADLVMIYLRCRAKLRRQSFQVKQKRQRKSPAATVLKEELRYAVLILSMTLGGIVGGVIAGFFFTLPTTTLLFIELPELSIILASVLLLIAGISVGIDLRHREGLLQSLLLTLAAFALFILINILFYSSFFSYWNGVSGALESVQVWAQTGTKEHAHPFYAYLVWLWQEESPLLILGTIGACLALIRRRNRFAVFASAWAFGILLAYSIIPYKTPWLMINFTVPLAIVGGYAINESYDFLKSLKLHFIAVALAAAALVVLSIQTVSLNFYHYDDDKYPYVYAHTRREFLTMVEDIEKLSKRAGTGLQTSITITSPEYWPLPWYLRDYEHAGFFGHMTTTNEPLVLGSIDQELELNLMLGDRYQKINDYPLRPGVTLVLYAKKELAGP